MWFSFTEGELSALREASLEATRLYIVLRQTMDFRTRIAGRGASKLSRARLASDAQYCPPQGSKRAPWKPGLREVDCLLDELTRIGLVKRVAVVHEFKKLVLHFPLAQVRQENERHMNVTNERNTERDTYRSDFNEEFCNSGGVERECFGDGERAISPSQCGDDEIVREGNFDGLPMDAPEVIPANRSAEWEATRRAFREALGASASVDSRLLSAIATVREVFECRGVSPREAVLAVDLARSKGATSVAAYAATIIQSGSLAGQTPVAMPRRQGGQVDPVANFLRDMVRGSE